MSAFKTKFHLFHYLKTLRGKHIQFNQGVCKLFMQLAIYITTEEARLAAVKLQLIARSPKVLFTLYPLLEDGI